MRSSRVVEDDKFGWRAPKTEMLSDHLFVCSTSLRELEKWAVLQSRRGTSGRSNKMMRRHDSVLSRYHTAYLSDLVESHYGYQQ